MRAPRPLALSTGFVLEEGLELDAPRRDRGLDGRAARPGRGRAGDRRHQGRRARATATGSTSTPPGSASWPTASTSGPERAGARGRGDRQRADRHARRRRPQRARGPRVRHRAALGHARRSPTLVAAMIGAPTVGSARAPRPDPRRSGREPVRARRRPRASASSSRSDAIPVPEAVQAACSFLGLDPIQVANEGQLVAFVARRRGRRRARGDARACPTGAAARSSARVTAEHRRGRRGPDRRSARNRVIDRPLGEQLPRIC